MCIWQMKGKKREEERGAFLNNSSSLRYIAHVHGHFSHSLPSLWAFMCSCDTSVVRTMTRVWHTHCTNESEEGNGMTCLLAKTSSLECFFSWIPVEQVDIMKRTYWIILVSWNLELYKRKGMVHLNLKDIFKKIKTHNKNTNQILTTLMQRKLLYQSKNL